MHDELARFTTDAIWPRSLRGKRIADIGCGGGSLLDHLRGLPAQVAAIDPDEVFGASLRKRGYNWYPTCAEAMPDLAGKLDFAFSIQVIEHVERPANFLGDIGRLLAPGGLAVVSTPNRRDILMDLLPDAFPGFFYRKQHRWAFDADTLADCAKRAGFAVLETRHVHRYGIANALHWLRDRRPRGRTPLPPLDAALDKLWQSWLEASGRSDNVYLVLARDGVSATR